MNYHSLGITIRDARNLCIVLGLSPSRHIVFCAELLAMIRNY